MHSYAPLVLAMAGVALAHEHGHQHFHEKREFFYPNGTSVAAGPTGTAPATEESTLIVYETKTVVPVAQAVSTTTSYAAASAVAANVAAVNAASSSGAAFAAYGGEQCGATATVTETEVVYVTVGGGSSTAAPVAATTYAAAAGAANSGSDSAAGAAGASSAAAYGSAWSNTTVAYTSSVVPQTTSAVNYANYQYGSPYGSSSAASSVATFATSTSAYVAASSAASTSSSSSGSKRGLSYNDASYTELFSGYDALTWAYNWASTADGSVESSLEYVPLLWGSASYDTWSANAQSAIDSGSSHLLAFNEPDMTSQADMSVSDAVTGYQTYMNPFSGSAELGSPAVTNSEESGEGLEWLESFLEECNGACDIDFVVIHWYADYTATDNFKTHVTDTIDLAANYGISKVWITEFQASGTDAQQQEFMDEILPWLDEQSAVERYAYFMCKVDILLASDTSVSDLGVTYASS